MDMYEFNRQFNGSVDENYEYKMKNVPNMYPQMTAVPNIMPSIVPVPMMTIRPGAELEYNRWLSGGYPQQYRSGYYDSHPFPPTRHHESGRSHERRVHSEDVGDLSPGFSGAQSPRYGPGPPIVTSDRVKGPKGCNLFVFHLPNEITNWDLYLLFRKFGTILSVHTMINKTTGLSKGYGFVSYAGREEAKAAITAMDGFRLDKKRLKVQVKRSQNDLLDDGGEEDDPELDESLYESAAVFASGETSGVTTRASTPRGPVPLHHQHTRSHSSNDSLQAVHEKPAEGEELAEGTEENDQEEGDDGAGLRNAHDLIVNSVAAVSLTPVTPREAEAQVRRAAMASVAASERTAASAAHTTTRTSTRDSVHHAVTTIATPAYTAPMHSSQAQAQAQGSIEKAGTTKRVVGLNWGVGSRAGEMAGASEDAFVWNGVKPASGSSFGRILP